MAASKRLKKKKPTFISVVCRHLGELLALISRLFTRCGHRFTLNPVSTRHIRFWSHHDFLLRHKYINIPGVGLINKTTPTKAGFLLSFLSVTRTPHTSKHNRRLLIVKLDLTNESLCLLMLLYVSAHPVHRGGCLSPIVSSLLLIAEPCQFYFGKFLFSLSTRCIAQVSLLSSALEHHY